LSDYQNRDGGFGKALEPDMRMQESSVIATKFALQILVDIQAPSREKLVRDGIAYMLSKFDREKQVWPIATTQLMDAPHAPWWNADGLEREFGSYLANPKAGIVRCLLDYRDLVPKEFLVDALSSLMAHFRTLPMEMTSFDTITFLQLLQPKHVDHKNRGQLLSKLKVTGCKIVSRKPREWHGFAIKPLWLAPSPKAPLAETLSSDIHANLDFEIDTQNEDGSWSPSWSWEASYPDSWKTAEKEWKGILTLAMLRSLRDFGRIDGYTQESIPPIYKYHID
jgi:hypothetical protein